MQFPVGKARIRSLKRRRFNGYGAVLPEKQPEPVQTVKHVGPAEKVGKYFLRRNGAKDVNGENEAGVVQRIAQHHYGAAPLGQRISGFAAR